MSVYVLSYDQILRNVYLTVQDTSYYLPWASQVAQQHSQLDWIDDMLYDNQQEAAYVLEHEGQLIAYPIPPRPPSFWSELQQSKLMWQNLLPSSEDDIQDLLHPKHDNKNREDTKIPADDASLQVHAPSKDVKQGFHFVESVSSIAATNYTHVNNNGIDNTSLSVDDNKKKDDIPSKEKNETTEENKDYYLATVAAMTAMISNLATESPGVVIAASIAITATVVSIAIVLVAYFLYAILSKRNKNETTTKKEIAAPVKEIAEKKTGETQVRKLFFPLFSSPISC